MFNWKAWILALLAIAGVALYSKTLYDWGQDAANLANKAKTAEAVADKEREFREREQQLQNQLNNQQVQHDHRLDEMQRTASSASADADRLRKQVADLRQRLSSSSSDVAGDSWQLPSVTRAAMVLSELYGSCVGHRQELANGLDQARQRGLAVEQMYDRARGQ